jgi:histone H3/H4
MPTLFNLIPQSLVVHIITVSAIFGNIEKKFLQKLLQNFLQFFCENTKTFAKTRKRKFKPNDN